MWGGILSKVNDSFNELKEQANALQQQVESSFEDALHYDPESAGAKAAVASAEEQIEETSLIDVAPNFTVSERTSSLAGADRPPGKSSQTKAEALQAPIGDDFFGDFFNDDVSARSKSWNEEPSKTALKDTEPEALLAENVVSKDMLGLNQQSEKPIERKDEVADLDFDFDWGEEISKKETEHVTLQVPSASEIANLQHTSAAEMAHSEPSPNSPEPQGRVAPLKQEHDFDFEYRQEVSASPPAALDDLDFDFDVPQPKAVDEAKALVVSELETSPQEVARPTSEKESETVLLKEEVASTDREAELSNVKLQLDQLKELLDRERQANEAAQGNVRAGHTRNEELEKQIVNARSELEAAQGNVRTSHKRNEELEKQLVNARSELEAERTLHRQQAEAGSEDSKTMRGELDKLQNERKQTLRDIEVLREERSGLMEEGVKMSKRVLAVEQRMKDEIANARRADGRVAELENAKEALQGQVNSLSSRAETAETLVVQQRGELKQQAKELEKIRSEVHVEQGKLEAQQKLQQERSRESDERESAISDKFERIRRERDELLANNSAMRAELDRALLTKERTEARLQHHLIETNQASEEQRQREMEIAEQNVPLAQRIAELEAQLGEQELCEADVRRDLEAAHASLENVRNDLKQSIHTQEVQAQELDRIRLESSTSVTEATEARSARVIAEQDRERIEAEMQSVKSRSQELAEQVASLTQQLLVMQDTVARSVAEATSAPQEPFLDSMEPSEEVQRLRSQVETLARERDALEQEKIHLQGELIASNGIQKQSPQRQFELALQAIGQLQDELEACKDDRDQYREYSRRLLKSASGKDTDPRTASR